MACKHGIIYANYPQHILDFKGKMCKYFFTANLTPFQIAKSAGIFATKQGWGKRWHMLGDNYSWPQMVLRGYEKVAKEVGADWTGVTWAPFPTQDYSAQIDEPTEGLMPELVRAIADTLIKIQKDGVAILLVEQNTKLALEITQRTYLVEKGGITYEGRSADLAKDYQTRLRYLGV